MARAWLAAAALACAQVHAQTLWTPVDTLGTRSASCGTSPPAYTTALNYGVTFGGNTVAQDLNLTGLFMSLGFSRTMGGGTVVITLRAWVNLTEADSVTGAVIGPVLSSALATATYTASSSQVTPPTPSLAFTGMSSVVVPASGSPNAKAAYALLVQLVSITSSGVTGTVFFCGVTPSMIAPPANVRMLKGTGTPPAWTVDTTLTNVGWALNFGVPPSPTPTASGTGTPTITPTSSRSPSGTRTPSSSATFGTSPSQTPSITASNSGTASITPSNTGTVSFTATNTASRSATRSGTPSVTPTGSITPSVTPTTSYSSTITASSSATPTASATASGTLTLTATPSRTASMTATSSRSTTATFTPSITPSASSTNLVGRLKDELGAPAPSGPNVGLLAGAVGGAVGGAVLLVAAYVLYDRRSQTKGRLRRQASRRAALSSGGNDISPDGNGPVEQTVVYNIVGLQGRGGGGGGALSSPNEKLLAAAGPSGKSLAAAKLKAKEKEKDKGAAEGGNKGGSDDDDKSTFAPTVQRSARNLRTPQKGASSSAAATAEVDASMTVSEAATTAGTAAADSGAETSAASTVELPGAAATDPVPPADPVAVPQDGSGEAAASQVAVTVDSSAAESTDAAS